MPLDSVHGPGTCCISWFLIIIFLTVLWMWCQAFWIVMGCRVSGPAALSGSKDEMASCIHCRLFVIDACRVSCLCLCIWEGRQGFEPQVQTFNYVGWSRQASKGRVMLIPTCWIEISRTVRSSDPCRFAVLGEVSHVTGDFPGPADVIHWNEGNGLDPLERSSDVRAHYFVLQDKVLAGDRRSSSIGTVSSGRSSQGQKRNNRGFKEIRYMSSYSACRNIVLSQYSAFTILPLECNNRTRFHIVIVNEFSLTSAKILTFWQKLFQIKRAYHYAWDYCINILPYTDDNVQF